MLLLLFAGIQRHLEGELAGIDLADIEDAFQQVDFCRSAGCGASVDSVRDLRMPCGFCAAKCRSRIVRSVDERVYLRRLQFIYQLQDFRHHVVPLRRNISNPYEAESGDPPAGEFGVGIELGNLGKSLRGLVRGLRQWPGLEELLFQHPLAHSELLFAPGFLLADPVVHPESAGPEAVPHISLLLKRPVAVV